MHKKGNYKQGEEKAFKMGERINFPNIQAAHDAQYQKNKGSNQKTGQSTKQTFLQRRHMDG